MSESTKTQTEDATGLCCDTGCCGGSDDVVQIATPKSSKARAGADDAATSPMSDDDVRSTVREAYAKVAEQSSAAALVGDAAMGAAASCCGDSGEMAAAMSEKLGYTSDDVTSVPEGANMGLGCGNPMAIASLKEGETVVDLGSGGGFDCFLSAKQVGEAGRVIGVDMTPEMVSKARKNAEKGGYENVDFRLGEIEHLPVADNTADVIISNCVINLAPDKAVVYEDAFRALKPGGRLAISDVVMTAELPEEMLNDPVLLASCVAGALQVDQIESILQEAGYEQVVVKPKDESREFIREWTPDGNIADYVMSANIEAVKPSA